MSYIVANTIAEDISNKFHLRPQQCCERSTQEFQTPKSANRRTSWRTATGFRDENLEAKSPVAVGESEEKRKRKRLFYSQMAEIELG